MDRLSKERRSWLMSRVGSKNTSPEMRVRSAAHRMGLRFRLHRKDLPGRPDLVFPKYSVALFVHGCFWHRHPGCSKASTPKTHTGFWNAKFERNEARDQAALSALSEMGWTPLVLWECETKSDDALIEGLRRVRGDVVCLN